MGRGVCAEATVQRRITELHTAHATLVRAHARKLLRNEHDAEDIVQEVFLRATRALSRGMGWEGNGRWLLTIAQNAAIDLLRTRTRDPYPLHDLTLVAGGTDPGDACATRESIDHVLEACACLSASQRDVFVLRELGGARYAELQERRGSSRNQVESALWRSRRSFEMHHAAIVTGQRCVDIANYLREGARSLRWDRMARAHLEHCTRCQREGRKVGLVE